MDRFSKVVIALSACAAVAWQVTRLLAWPNLPLITAIVAIVACVLTRIDRRAIGLVLVTGYSFNVIVRYVQGPPYPPFAVLWLAALLGAILPRVLTTGWHLPRLWRGALVFVALVTIVGAPIIVWREVDGALPLAFGVDIHWLGGAPPFIVSWVLHVAIMAVVGILWFDWLLGEPNLDVERTVITPLIVGVVVMSAASAYQTFVDIHFFNETVYGYIGRATGTMWDANLAGMLAALWLGGAILWADRLRGWTLYFAPIAVILTAIAAWASGSRSALGVMLIVACGVMVAFAVSAGRFHTRRLTMVSIAAGVLVGSVVVLGLATRSSANPAGRLMNSLITYAIYGGVAPELWNRNGYGTAATVLIRRYPISGVGIGSFPTFVGQIGQELGIRLPPDNAQNWLRHQIAELGVIGAAGWALWLFAFAAFVFVPRKSEPANIWIVRAMLVGFGFASLLGMPGQDPFVAITFWTIAFWYVSLAARPDTGKPLGRWTWLAMGGAVAVFAASSIWLANGDLRVTQRAIREKVPLSYGFAAAQSAGDTAGYRPTDSRATALVDATARWMSVSVRLADQSANAGPIEVRVWKDGASVLKAQLKGTAAITGFVPVEQIPSRVLVETEARRLDGFQLWPSFRDLGLLVKWEFVDNAPPDVHRYQARLNGGL